MEKSYLKGLFLSLVALPYAVNAVTGTPEVKSLNLTELQARGWEGFKAYPYSPNCGEDGDTYGYTWDYLSNNQCVNYWENGERLDMWSFTWGDYDTVAEWLDCTDPCYDVTVAVNHCGYNCNCGAGPWTYNMGGVGYGCVKPGASIKSFSLICGPSDCG